MTQGMVQLDPTAFEAQGFERVETLAGSTFRDNATVIIVPTRGVARPDPPQPPDLPTVQHFLPVIHTTVMQGLLQLVGPMNTKRGIMFATGDEVGVAYCNLVKAILADPQFSRWPFIMTIEDDNVVPADAHIRLLEVMHAGNYDCVSGIYYTKGPVRMPMAYGDPEEFRRTGVLDFRPRDIQEGLKRGNVMDVNGVGMGCALWRMSMFREIDPPWFVSVADVIPQQGACQMTQDLYFCERARRAGRRFAVDLRVGVGHLDIETGRVW